jgi:hypothetical protein
LPAQYRVVSWTPTSSPYWCSFRLAGPGLDPATDQLPLQVVIDARQDWWVANPGPLEDDSAVSTPEVAGHRWLLLRGPADSCTARFPVGALMDGNRPGVVLEESEVETARIRMVVELQGPCAAVEVMQPAAVEAFG